MTYIKIISALHFNFFFKYIPAMYDKILNISWLQSGIFIIFLAFSEKKKSFAELYQIYFLITEAILFNI